MGPDPLPLLNHKNVEVFFSNIGPNSVNVHKNTKPACNGVLLAGQYWPAYSGIYLDILSLHQQNNIYILDKLAQKRSLISTFVSQIYRMTTMKDPTMQLNMHP